MINREKNLELLRGLGDMSLMVGMSRLYRLIVKVRIIYIMLN